MRTAEAKSFGVFAIDVVDRMFSWLTRKSGKATQLMPENKWLLVCDGEVLRVVDDKQNAKQLAKSDLTGVIVETNDSGPWGIDVWRLLFGPDDRSRRLVIVCRTNMAADPRWDLHNEISAAIERLR